MESQTTKMAAEIRAAVRALGVVVHAVTAPWRTDGKSARLTMSELTLLLEGSEMAGNARSALRRSS